MTLKDIAKEANVSVSTVSRVLNSKGSLKGKESYQKIWEIVKREHYIPNKAAQALKKNDVVSRKVQFNETGEISLDYGTVQVLLGGQENLTQKILRLSYILPELSGKTGTLHVENWTENTTDIIFDETT